MNKTISKRSLLVTSVAAAMVVAMMPLGATHAAESFSPNVDSKGNISLPKDFRNQMVHLGSWFVPEGGASGFHDVYTEPETVAAYRRTGQFPDGATLIKELRAANAADYTTGKGVSHATTIKQWFVMVKDAKGRFGKNPVWGDGWGWALFKTDQPMRNAATDYKKDCLGCHVPAKAKDWIYVEGYPTLTKP